MEDEGEVRFEPESSMEGRRWERSESSLRKTNLHSDETILDHDLLGKAVR